MKLIRTFFAGLLLVGTAGSALAQSTGCVASGGTNCPARIPDAPQAPLVSTITLAAASCPANSRPALNVSVNITHSSVGDLVISLANPASTSSTLLSNLQGIAGACTGSDVNATFRDGGATATCSFLITSVSGTLAPATPLSPLRTSTGISAGTWTLTVADTSNGGDGALNDWSVRLDCGVAGDTHVPATSWISLSGIAVLIVLIALVQRRRMRAAR